MKKLFVRTFGKLVSFDLLPQKFKDLIMWPLATRVLGTSYKQEVRLADGYKMFGSMGDILCRQVLFLGPYKNLFWEPKTSTKLKELSDKAREILIAGTHIGYLVLLAAKNTQGRVHTFEPIPNLFQAAEANFKLNPELANKIVFNREALGEKQGKVEMYGEDIRSSAIAYSGAHIADGHKMEAPVTTIDDYARTRGVSKLDLILLDIEGAEWFALNGATTILKTRPDLILEISPRILKHTSITSEMILERLQNLGYKVEYLDQDKDYANVYATTKKLPEKKP